jgi:hypothetical protein
MLQVGATGIEEVEEEESKGWAYSKINSETMGYADRRRFSALDLCFLSADTKR